MFYIDSEQTIHLTRGDVAVINVTAAFANGNAYTFKAGSVLRLRVFRRRHPEDIVISKDVLVSTPASVVPIALTRADTKIGDLIKKPKTYWYEIELDPDTVAQTIIGYGIDGPKLFILYPEGAD